MKAIRQGNLQDLNGPIANRVSVSEGFKQQVYLVILSIFFFILVYLLMLALAVGLASICVYIGFTVLMSKISFLTIMLGIGLASIGVFVLFFLLKFVFASNKIDRTHMIEIFRKDEPALFELIDEIVKKVGTSFPKRIYLTSEVNAAVFYDSSFWSMFLPVRKNLQIGLGLVNSVTRAELKGILAHEFGHFSQDSMRLGSYIYNVNKIIYNLVADNEGFESTMRTWGNLHGFLTLFAAVASGIIVWIQWVLRKVYEIINKVYMGLSREMEFHADEIAARMVGVNPLKNSLLRTGLADQAFNMVIGFYDRKIPELKKSRNIFIEHQFVMAHACKEDGVEMENGLPKVTLALLNRQNKSKLIVVDQWASHPSTEDRIQRLEQLELQISYSDDFPAATIFNDPVRRQEELTQKLFSQIEYAGTPAFLTDGEFEDLYRGEYQDNSFSKIYNGYYDIKNPSLFEIKSINDFNGVLSELEIFSDSNVELVNTDIALLSDIGTIKQIKDKVIKVRTFDYDGVKYKSSNAESLLARLEKEQEAIKSRIAKHDAEIYRFFRSLEIEGGSDALLEKFYKEFFEYDKIYDERMEVFNQLNAAFEFLSKQTPFEQILLNIKNAREQESKFKAVFNEMKSGELLREESKKVCNENIETFLTKELDYFTGEQYLEGDLQLLSSAMNTFVFLNSRGYFLLKKKLLDYQAELMDRHRKID